MRPVPDRIARWLTRRRWLRWCDALVAVVLVVAGGAVQGLRSRWRPISGWVGLRLSAGLRPGDRAWYLRAHEASMVVVTARRGVRLVVARPDLQDEGISVRRTRVFVLPVDGS